MFTDKPQITEHARTIPVIEEVDVLVVGGGPAGVCAALSAGRCGLRVLLIERYNHLGGLWTGGLVLPLLATHAVDKNGDLQQAVFGIGAEIIERLRTMGMAERDIDPIVDPEATKYLFDAMMNEEDIKILYNVWASNVIMDGNRIDAVILESKSGRVGVRGKMVIDTTGDGDIFAFAGEDFKNLPYHIGLVHRLGNTDRIDRAAPGFSANKSGKGTAVPGVNWVNMRGEDGSDGLDLYVLSELTHRYRMCIWEQVQVMRTQPGYEKVFLLDTASQLGVRVTRLLKGQYTLTLEDSMTFRRFEDPIGYCGSWRAINYKGKTVKRENRPIWQIPLRSLIPVKTENLLTAGRCFSYEPAHAEDGRIMSAAVVTGHAAGAAAAASLQTRTSVQKVPYTEVKNVLLEQKAYLG